MVWVLLRPTRESESAARWDVRFFVPIPSSEPGAVSPAGWGKRRDESSKAKGPGYRPSPDHFKTVKRMLAPHCAQLLSPIGEQHRLSVPECVRTRLLLSRHSVLYLSSSFMIKVVRARETFIFYFTNQKRNYRWLGKTFGRTIRICTSFPFPTPPRPLFAYPSLSRLPHSFASSPLSESLEQAKELQVLVRSVRTRYACNFQDMWK